MKKLVALLLALAMVFALAACGSGNTSTPSSSASSGGSATSTPDASTSADASTSGEATTGTGESPVAGKKIAYIMLMSSATIFQMWSDSFTETAKKLGMTADTFFCSDNADTWKSTIEQCAQGGYDGLMVSHGGQEYAWDFLSGILEQYPDLKIVTFDTPFKDANGEVQKIEGVTQFFQQDAGFAESTRASPSVSSRSSRARATTAPSIVVRPAISPMRTTARSPLLSVSPPSMIRTPLPPCVT